MGRIKKKKKEKKGEIEGGISKNNEWGNLKKKGERGELGKDILRK